MNGCHVIASRPTDRSWNLPVGASRGYRLCQPNEVAQARVRSKTDDDMHVVCQYRVAQHAHTGPAASALERAANVHRRRQVEAPHAVPRVPRDVRVQLIGTVSRHVALERQALLTPGRKPGVHGPGASPGFANRAQARRSRTGRKPGVREPGASWGSPNGGEIDRQRITGTPPRQATNLRARETGGSLTPGTPGSRPGSVRPVLSRAAARPAPSRPDRGSRSVAGAR